MAWPNTFRRTTANTVKAWDYTFDVTPEHPTPESMHPLKFTYDTLAEKCYERLNEISPPPNKNLPRNNGQFTQDVKEDEKKAHRDLYVILKEHHEEDEMLSNLWKEVNTVPDWVDWDQIARGQDVFYRYGGANLTGLAYQSLLGGMGAARVAETLARTGGFSTKVARRRLYETTQHILQCTKSLESIQPGGDGWASTIRVRLLHAAVRARIMSLQKTRPEYYNTEEWGIPINDLDSIATIGTFSSTLIWLSLPRQGIYLRHQEILDYLALWRYVGYLIGSPTDPFSTPEKAKKTIESLLYHEIRPSDTSKILANNIIRSLENRPPIFASPDMLIASARWLNGNDLCDALGLMQPSLYYSFLMAGQCTFYMVMCYAYRYIPYLDRKKINFLRRAFWVMIVDSQTGLEGQETFFEFKYVPEFSTVTEMGEGYVGAREGTSIETRNLRWLLCGVAGLGCVSYLSAKLVGVVGGMVWG
ncbi:hypothetical protein EG328_011145 [Venturia inaequalis]|uniref:ER-bound oxygenase mpaB/mpaB'/Rubber oxygenase catalytic domain-containing protein n=1 Tax=Venturia inaequalis TaxID=5025 RepID=A0A8H3VGK4_VENIN|nr:hypothetical protein EG328_011145 [Venturia inaequalis]